MLSFQQTAEMMSIDDGSLLIMASRKTQQGGHTSTKREAEKINIRCVIRGERCVAAELQLVKLVRVGRCRRLRGLSEDLKE